MKLHSGINGREQFTVKKSTRARGEFYISLAGCVVCKCINDHFPSKLPGRRAWHRVHWDRSNDAVNSNKTTAVCRFLFQRADGVAS